MGPRNIASVTRCIHAHQNFVLDFKLLQDPLRVDSAVRQNLQYTNNHFVGEHKNCICWRRLFNDSYALQQSDLHRFKSTVGSQYFCLLRVHSQSLALYSLLHSNSSFCIKSLINCAFLLSLLCKNFFRPLTTVDSNGC